MPGHRIKNPKIRIEDVEVPTPNDPRKESRQYVKFDEKMGELICELMANGWSMRQITKLDGMPGRTNINRWILKGFAEDAPKDLKRFAESYTRAKDLRVNFWEEEIIDISDDTSNDWMEREHPNGGSTKVADKEVVLRARLRIDTRKWLMSKLIPKRYGEKITQELTGADGAELVPIVNVSIKPSRS